MDDDACGLVDDEQVLVLEGDPQRDVLPLDRPGLGLRLELDVLPAPELLALRRRDPVDGDVPALDQALSRGA
jgi:hypothetical protein